MKRIRYYVGTQQDKAGQAINPLDARDTIKALAQKLTKWAGSCTITTGLGFFESQHGLAIETCVILEVMKEDTLHGVDQEARKLAQTIKYALDQESVLLTIESVSAELV